MPRSHKTSTSFICVWNLAHSNTTTPCNEWHVWMSWSIRQTDRPWRNTAPPPPRAHSLSRPFRTHHTHHYHSSPTTHNSPLTVIRLLLIILFSSLLSPALHSFVQLEPPVSDLPPSPLPPASLSTACFGHYCSSQVAWVLADPASSGLVALEEVLLNRPFASQLWPYLPLFLLWMDEMRC